MLTRIVSTFAAVVVFITTYALVLPAITMESQADCGIPAHQHDDSCYEEQLICGQIEDPGHHHTDACYTTLTSLICTEQEHQHDDACYDEEGNLICELLEHTHDDACYEETRELTCELEESEGHQHTDACYERVLTCGLEAHTHSAACYTHVSDDTAGGSGASAEDYAVVAATTEAAGERVTVPEDVANSNNSDNIDGADNITIDAADTGLSGLPAEEDAYVPELEALFFDQILTQKTGIYYFHPEEGETIPENTADITDWTRVKDDTELAPADMLRVYLRYTIPAGSLNSTNPVARYRLPANLHLSDEQMEEINTNVNGIANQYVNLDTLEILDPDQYNQYLGIEAVEGTRTPADDINEYFDKHPDMNRQEYISATVQAENVYDTEGLYGEKDAYLGQDLIFTFTPYTVQKNQHEYDADGQPTKAGEKVNGWLCFDVRMDQIDWSEPVVTTETVEEEIQDNQVDQETQESAGVQDAQNTQNAEEASDIDVGAMSELTADLASDTDKEAAAEPDINEDDETSPARMTTIEQKESTAKILFAAEDKSLKIDEISTELRMIERTEIAADDNVDGMQDDDTTETAENGDETDLAAAATDEDAENLEQTSPDDVNGADGSDDADTGEKTDPAIEINAETYPAVSFEDSIVVRAGTLSTDNESVAKDTPEETTIAVSVSAEPETFPLGTTMVLGAVDDMDTVASAVEGAVEGQTRGFHAVDISFIDPDGNEIEPLKPIKVSMTSEAIKQAVEDSSTVPVVMHVENPADSVATDPASDDSAETDAASHKADQETDSIDPASAAQTGNDTVADETSAGREEIPSQTDTTTSAPIATIVETIETTSTDKAAEKKETSDTLSFDAGSFSVYAIVYTVDFHWEVNGKMYEFTLPGGGFVSFYNLMEVLGVPTMTYNSSSEGENLSNDDDNSSENRESSDDKSIDMSGKVPGVNGQDTTTLTLDSVVVSDATRNFVADVEKVEFSSPELVDVSKVESEITVGGIKESRGLECEYSSELTVEQIAEINNTVVESGDWALISVQPFESEETLTVTMKTGEVFEIRVTDAQLKKTVIDAKGDTWEITVIYGPEAEIPEGSELKVREILPEDEEYEEYYQQSLEKVSVIVVPDTTEDEQASEVNDEDTAAEITSEENSVSTYAHIFDIQIWADDHEIQPASDVAVSIKLLDAPEEETDLRVVHFGKDGLEEMELTGDGEDAGKNTEGIVISFVTDEFSVYAIVTPTTVDALDGQEYALITWDGGKTGKGLTGDPHQDINGNLCAEFLTVMTKMSGNKQLQLFVPNNSNEQVTTWTFEQQKIDIFKLKAKIYSRGDDGKQIYVGEKYLNIGSDGKLSMVDDENNASEIKVNLQTSGVHKGQICLKCNGKTLTYSGEFENGFNTVGGTGNEWLYLAEIKPESELVGYQRTYTAEKISVSDPSLTPLFDGDTKKVIIYTRVWNGSGYTYFAINGNGELVQCHESGNEIEWKGSGLDELQWKFTEYGEWTTVYKTDEETGELVLDDDGSPIPELLFDDDGNPVYETDVQGNYVLDNNGNKIQRIKQIITPSYYYELQNAYTGQYLAPLISANQILSSDTVGLNMNGRRNGQYYTPILAWDGGNYSFASIEAALDASASAGAVIHPCARVDGMDLYFAIINDLEADDDLHTVPTVDNNIYGITMRMADYHTYIKGSGCDTSKEQDEILGSSKYTPNQTRGLLSTNLGSDGYPIANYSNKSLGELYTAKQDANHNITVNENVNHLFVESTYKATGYYEYDSSQNYAYLTDTGDFRVYQELGAHDYGKEKPTLKHGQFLPYHDIEAGHFAEKNGRNLYTPTGVAIDPSDPRYNEQLYLANYEGDHPDFCFGVELTAGFYQTPSGLDAWGHDIIFEFSGDDDFWLYVDGELVIDLGGIHSALPASVNFRTGKVIINGEEKTLRDVFIDNYKGRGMSDEEAENEADKIFVTKYDEELEQYVTTFKDNGYHEMRIFYMERGWSASNLHMKFNLAAVERGTVQLTKELDVDGEDMSNSVLATFPYQIWYKDPLYEKYVQLTEQTLGNRGSVKYLGSNNEVEYKREIYVDNTYIDKNSQVVQCSVKYEGVYLVDPGETVVITFPVFGETGQEKLVSEYKIVECGVDPNVYPSVTLDDGRVLTPDPVNTTIRVTERDPRTGLPTATGIGLPTVDGNETKEVYSGLCNYGIEYDSPDNRSKVKYKNNVPETEELLIQKNLYKKEGTAEPQLIPKSDLYDDDGKPLDSANPEDLKTTYDFRVSFKTPYDTDYTPANVYQYHVKDAGGYYCKWQPADTSSSNPNEEGSQGCFVRITNSDHPNGVKVFDDLTDDTIVDGHVVHREKFAATFDTSINGAISQIPAYYTVEIQGLIPGTQFKVVERPNETPDGYEFYRYELNGNGTPVVPYSNVSDVSAGDNRVTAANFASRRSKLYTKDAGGEYHPLSDEDTFDQNETYYEVDPWVGVVGTIVKDKESEVLVDNYKGYALHLYKTWADASTMANRFPAYFAVYYETNNQGGDIVSRTLVTDSVRRLEYQDNPQELYWFYMHLPPVTDVTDPEFENYVVREVALTGEGISVNDEGAVIGYDTINVVENGGNVTIKGLSNSQDAEWKDIAYKVTYTKTQTVGTSLRKFWVTDTPSDRPAVKFLKEDWSGNPLEGARFTLTQGNTMIFDKVSVKETESSNQAVVSIEHLTANTDYVLEETLAPQEYYGLQENLTFQLVTDTSSGGIGWTLNVTPNTGDIKDYYDVGFEQVTETIDGQEVVTAEYVTLTIKNRPYDFVVIKEDAVDHTKLKNVKFKLWEWKTVNGGDWVGPMSWDDGDPSTDDTILKTDKNGVIPHLDNNLPAGTYQLREQEINNRYIKIGNIDFTVSPTGEITLGSNPPDGVEFTGPVDGTGEHEGKLVYTMTVPNTPKPLKLKKVNEFDINQSLTGAKFSLSKSDENKNAAGKLIFGPMEDPLNGYNDINMTAVSEFVLDKLPAGYYCLEETETPDGYVLGQRYYYFRIKTDRTITLCDENGKDQGISYGDAILTNSKGDYTITIKNTPGAALPNTGGPGTNLIYLLGFLMTGLAGAGLVMKIRRRNAA